MHPTEQKATAALLAQGSQTLLTAGRLGATLSRFRLRLQKLD